jgi:hypothetical protein
MWKRKKETVVDPVRAARFNLLQPNAVLPGFDSARLHDPQRDRASELHKRKEPRTRRGSGLFSGKNKVTKHHSA